jgi:hypothetical protein
MGMAKIHYKGWEISSLSRALANDVVSQLRHQTRHCGRRCSKGSATMQFVRTTTGGRHCRRLRREAVRQIDNIIPPTGTAWPESGPVFQSCCSRRPPAVFSIDPAAHRRSLTP